MTEQTQDTTVAQAAATAKVKKTVNEVRAGMTQADVQAKLFLEAETGYFYSKVDVGRVRVGDFVGQIRPADGYYTVAFGGVNHSGAALRQFYTDGTWPEAKVAAPKAAAERAPREARKPPVITEEMKAAAKLAAKTRAENAKAAKQVNVATAATEA